MGRKARLLIFTLVVITAAAAAVPQNLQNRIIGGEIAPDNVAPHQISLQTLPGDHLCGGVIVASSWILTAGHCVSGWRADYLRVATGSNNYRVPLAVYYPDAIYLHCNFDRPKYHNDIALLHLNTSLIYDERTKAIEFHYGKLQDNEDLWFTGWGSTELWQDPPEQLQQLKLHQVPLSKCTELLDEQEIDDMQVDVSHVCALATEAAVPGKGVCHGDSGGPLINANGKLVGVLNWYYWSCAQGLPDMFTRVSYFRDWMRRVMSGNRRCKYIV